MVRGLLTFNRLCKRFLMDLPEGVYIVSNRRKTVGPNKFEPVFQEQVAALEERQAQWERIKAAVLTASGSAPSTSVRKITRNLNPATNSSKFLITKDGWITLFAN